MTIIEKMKQDWDRRAHIDARYWVEPAFWEDEKSFQQSAVSDSISLMEGVEKYLPTKSRVLDIGCGIGRMMDILADKHDEIVGIDVSQEMINIGRKTLSHKKNLHFFETNGVDLSIFEDHSFDFVYSYAALPHMPKAVLFHYFQEISRVLKKNRGILKVQLWKGAPNAVPDSDTITPRVLSEKEFNQLHTENGFELLSVTEHEYIDPVLSLHPLWCTYRKNPQDMSIKKCNSFCSAEITEKKTTSETETTLLLHYGSTMIEKGDFQKAKDALTEAVKLDPKSINGYTLLTHLFLEEGSLGEAIHCLERAVQEIPEYTEGQRYLNTLYSVRKKTDCDLQDSTGNKNSIKKGLL